MSDAGIGGISPNDWIITGGSCPGEDGTEPEEEEDDVDRSSERED